MSYTLIFYTIDAPPEPDRDPDAVAAWIAANGTPFADMTFSAGGAASFLETLEQILGLPVYKLYSAPIFGVPPDEDDPIYGTLTWDEGHAMVAAIDQLLANPNQKVKTGETAVEAARRVTSRPSLFFDRARELREILGEALMKNGQLVTMYS